MTGRPPTRRVAILIYDDHCRVATSAGISAGIDLALHLVERCEGAELARRTARQMDYPLTGT